MPTRKIKDAELDGEKVYFASHAKATYMSDGRTVESVINSLGGSADPDGKQDKIEDLDAIRSGAALGATAVQPSELASVAKSGSYTDLTNKPTIPSAVTESTVSGWGFTKNTGTITGVSANGTSVATSGVANIPAASTSKYGVTKLSSATNSSSTSLAATASAVKSAYDLANGRQEKLVSGTNIKTINGASILGRGDIVIEGGSSAYPRVDHGVTNTTFSLSPNTFYVWGEVDTLDLSFAEEQAGVANEYLFQFTSSEEPTTLTLPDTIQWVNEVKIESKKIHQVSVMDNIGIIACPSRVIIRFSVVKTGVTSEYTCELGMTWGEWVNSAYVRDGWHNYQGYITSPDMYQINDVDADDIIESGRIYSTW